MLGRFAIGARVLLLWQHTRMYTVLWADCAMQTGIDQHYCCLDLLVEFNVACAMLFGQHPVKFTLTLTILTTSSQV